MSKLYCQMVVLLWAVLATLRRMLALVLFFVPSLGLLDLLHHWQAEQRPFWVRRDAAARGELAPGDTLQLIPRPWIALTQNQRTHSTPMGGSDVAMKTRHLLEPGLRSLDNSLYFWYTIAEGKTQICPSFSKICRASFLSLFLNTQEHPRK